MCNYLSFSKAVVEQRPQQPVQVFECSLHSRQQTRRASFESFEVVMTSVALIACYVDLFTKHDDQSKHKNGAANTNAVTVSKRTVDTSHAVPTKHTAGYSGLPLSLPYPA